jgi:hypothetical protein
MGKQYFSVYFFPQKLIKIEIFFNSISVATVTIRVLGHKAQNPLTTANNERTDTNYYIDRCVLR